MKKYLKYLITVAIGFACVGFIIWAKDIFSQSSAVDVYHILCDAFFAVGVVITGLGLLMFTTNEGAFDMFVYGFSSFINMFRSKSTKKYETYYDYKVSRSSKKMEFGFMLICGSTFLVISFVMYFLYLGQI